MLLQGRMGRTHWRICDGGVHLGPRHLLEDSRVTGTGFALRPLDQLRPIPGLVVDNFVNSLAKPASEFHGRECIEFNRFISMLTFEFRGTRVLVLHPQRWQIELANVFLENSDSFYEITAESPVPQAIGNVTLDVLAGGIPIA